MNKNDKIAARLKGMVDIYNQRENHISFLEHNGLYGKSPMEIRRLAKRIPK